jgi:hypothetical protein
MATRHRRRLQMRHSALDGQHGKATRMSDNLRQISQDNRN